jgi:hypothetical protein
MHAVIGTVEIDETEPTKPRNFFRRRRNRAGGISQASSTAALPTYRFVNDGPGCGAAASCSGRH